MTRTTQPYSRFTIEKAEKTGKTGTEEITCDIKAVYDSLNKLCETLGRLNYVMQRKDMEVNLAQNSPKYG